MAVDQVVKREFSPRQVEVLLTGLEMASKSYKRRIVAETDSDAMAVWQRKTDEINVLIANLRR
jgi:hypothetical protein